MHVSTLPAVMLKHGAPGGPQSCVQPQTVSVLPTSRLLREPVAHVASASPARAISDADVANLLSMTAQVSPLTTPYGKQGWTVAFRQSRVQPHTLSLSSVLREGSVAQEALSNAGLRVMVSAAAANLPHQKVITPVQLCSRS